MGVTSPNNISAPRKGNRQYKTDHRLDQSIDYDDLSISQVDCLSIKTALNSRFKKLYCPFKKILKTEICFGALHLDSYGTKYETKQL